VRTCILSPFLFHIILVSLAWVLLLVVLLRLFILLSLVLGVSVAMLMLVLLFPFMGRRCLWSVHVVFLFQLY